MSLNNCLLAKTGSDIKSKLFLRLIVDMKITNESYVQKEVVLDLSFLAFLDDFCPFFVFHHH